MVLSHEAQDLFLTYPGSRQDFVSLGQGVVRCDLGEVRDARFIFPDGTSFGYVITNQLIDSVR